MNYSKTTLLDAAIDCSSVKIVDEILKNEKFDTTKNNILQSFKYFLIYCNFSDDIANNILEFDAKNTHLIDFHGSSYFFIFDYAIYRNYIIGISYEKIEFLLDHGADPNVPNENGVYPFAYAIHINSKPYVSALLKSNKVDLTKHITAERKKVGFLSNGVSDFKEKVNFTAKYTTYLHLAAKSEFFIKIFLKLDSININELDEQGNTPLMYAVANKCHESIQALFDFEGQELDYLHVNNDGKNALTMLKCSNEVKQDIHDKEQFKEALLNYIRENREDRLKYKFNINNKRDENNSKSEDTNNKPKEEKLDTEQLDKEKKSNQQQQEEKNSGSGEKSASLVPNKPTFSFKQIGLKTNQQQQEVKDSESGEKSPSSVPKSQHLD